jgi:hypothetical protein
MPSVMVYDGILTILCSAKVRLAGAKEGSKTPHCRGARPRALRAREGCAPLRKQGDFHDMR